MSTVVRAPGRVNLIGDHTDYTGGLVLPMAIDRWTVLDVNTSDGVIDLRSADEPVPIHLDLPVADPADVEPSWGRYVAGVAAEMGAATGVTGTVSTTIPIGAGLSSSAALEVATALALGFEGPAVELAQLCRRAEQSASGVPCGIMDQLCISAGVEGHALLIDCDTLGVSPVPVPTDVDVVVVFVAARRLAGSEYAERVAQCAQAERLIGPLRDATLHDVSAISDPVIAARARHVVTENERVRLAADALRHARIDEVGRLMVESHRSLATDFGTSTDAMDRAVHDLLARTGVVGARMTGGGFGGCVVALVDRHHAERVARDAGGWIVRPVGAACRI